MIEQAYTVYLRITDPILFFLGVLIAMVLGFTAIMVTIVQGFTLIAIILGVLLALFFVRLVMLQIDWSQFSSSEEET